MSVLMLQDTRSLDRQDPAEVLSAIEQLRSKNEFDGVNWQAVAMIAATTAREQLSLDWARVAVEVYTILSEIRHHHAGGVNEQIDSMMVRAFLIARLGHRPGDDILDACDIVDWFESSTQLTAGDAIKLAAQLRGKSEITDDERAAMLTLRRIKNRLKVIQLIEGVESVRNSASIQEWMHLSPLLP